MTIFTLWVNGRKRWLFAGNDPITRNQFGYQAGTGLLFPVGKRIAIKTSLAFQSRRREFIRLNEQDDIVSEHRWTKEVALSVGLSVIF